MMKGKERESNIELLRILAMCMIISMHYWSNSGAFESLLFRHNPADVGNAVLFHLSESMCIGGVNLFVLITGFFSVRQQTIYWRKIMRLLVDVAFWGLVGLLLGSALGWTSLDPRSLVRVAIPYLWNNRWFVESYLILLLLIPFINLCLRQIRRSGHQMLLAVAVGLFVLWPSFLPNPPIDDFGYGFVHFITLYLTAAYIRLYVTKYPPASVCLLVAALATALIFAGAAYGFMVSWAYNFVLVLVQSVSLFLFFGQLSIRSSVINTLAGYSFGIFLIHSDSSFFAPFVYNRIFHASDAIHGQVWVLALNLTVCVVAFYLFCVVLEHGKRWLFRYSVDKWIDRQKWLEPWEIKEARA